MTRKSDRRNGNETLVIAAVALHTTSAYAVSKEERLAWGAANIVLYDKHCHRVTGFVEEAYKMVESVPVEIIRKTGELAIVAYNELGAATMVPFMRPRIERALEILG